MSSERYTPPAEEAHNLVLPNVEFHPSLNNPDVPYTVNFDAERCSRMLRDLGFSDNQISNTNINLTRKHPLRLVGSAKPLSSIKLYCDPIWALFDKYSADLNELADINSSSKTKKKSGKSLSKNLYTKKLTQYINNVSPERSLPFAQRLVSNAVARKANGVLLHEVQHKIDLSIKPDYRQISLAIGEKLSAVAAGSAVGFASCLTAFKYLEDGNIPAYLIASMLSGSAVLFPVGQYMIDPLERKARQFQNKNQNDPNYRGILTFSLQKPQSGFELSSS